MRAIGLEPTRVLPHQDLNLARLPISPRPRRPFRGPQCPIIARDLQLPHATPTLTGMDDVFHILGLPRRFDLDLAELHARFIHQSSTHHPDRHTDPIAQAQAAEQSAEINHAYAVLSDPQRRADALLTLSGGPAKDQDKSLPPELLMDMMETRERMEEAVAADDQAELDRLRAWAHDQRQTHLAKVAGLFKDAGDTLAPSDAGAIRLELNALRYIQRMLDQMPE